MNTSFLRRSFSLLALLSVVVVAAPAQSITTADAFFSAISERYAGITDYSANIAITTGSTSRGQTMTGRVIFKKPNLLRIDFTNPSEQTIVFNGELLTIYLPGYNVVLSQSVEKPSGSSGATLATPAGLSLMKRYYTIAYETGPEPVAIDDKSQEQVVVLVLSRRTTTEMFRTIRVMISPESKMIRRIDARTVSGEHVVFDFTDYALNQGIADMKFQYDSPASANMYNNFLFNE